MPGLQWRLAEAVDRLGVPGAVAGLTRAGAREFAAAGRAGVGAAMTARTPVRVASVTKAVVATATLRALDTAGSTVDDLVLDLVPQLRELGTVPAGLTTRHLLGHTGGFDFDVPAAALAGCGDGDDALLCAVRTALRVRPRYPPGTVWRYSNIGYWLTGLVLARLTGSTFERALSGQVLTPAGMAHTGWRPPEQRHDIGDTPATGHLTGTAVVPVYQRGRRPSGGLWSTAADLLNFAEFLFDRPDLLERASRPVFSKTRGGRYALGWELAEGPVPVFWHDGDGSGFRARLLLVPAHRFAATVVVNDSRGRPVLDQVIGAELATLPGVALPGTLRQALTVADAVRRLAAAKLGLLRPD